MNGGKTTNANQPVDPPQLAGLNPQLVDSQQNTIPSTYFAGARRLKLLWIMNPVDLKTYPTGGNTKKAGSDNKPVAFYGSVAGITNCGQLDFVWGILKDDGVLFPPSNPFDDTLMVPQNWPANSFVVYLGKIWSNGATPTSNTPPAAPWTRYKQNITSNPTQFIVPNYGDIWIYKGTSTQVLAGAGAGEKFLTVHGHPPYRYRAVACLTQFFFQIDSPTPPNLSMLGARIPTQTIITGNATNMSDDWRVNVWTVIAELLTHPVYGDGILSTKFHLTSWQAQADFFYDRENGIGMTRTPNYIAPIYESQTKVRSIVNDLLAYVDGFIFWGKDGLLHAGHWPHGEAAPGGMTNLTWNDVVDEIAWDTDSWQSTSNAGSVNFNDAMAAFQSNSVPVMNGYNRQVTRRVQSVSLDRPFIVTGDHAAAFAAEVGKIGADPFFSASEVLRAEKCANLAQGDLFTLTDDVLQVTKVCRCLKKTIHAQPSGLVTIMLESERGIADVPYQATPAAPTNVNFPSPSRITNFQIFQLPGSLAMVLDKATSPTPYEIACLAGRNDSVTTTLDVWWKYAGGSFQDLNSQSAFAVAGLLNSTSDGADVVHEAVTASSTQGNTYALANSDIWNLEIQFGGGWATATLNTDYTADLTAGTITILTGGGIPDTSAVRANYSKFIAVHVATGTPQSDIDGISGSQTTDEIDDNSILIFVSQAGAPTLFEIMTVKSVTAVGGGVYNIAVRRQRYGTAFGGDGSYVFTTSDPSFVIIRETISQFTHVSFAALYAALATATFRLTPGTAWKQADVTDVYDAVTNPTGLTTETSLTFGDTWSPAASFSALLANTGAAGAWVAIADFSAAFAPATQFQFTATLTSPIGQLRSYSLASVVGSVRTILDSGQVSGATVSKSITFSLTNPGQYAMELSVTDTIGRITTIALPTLTTNTILIQSAAPTQTATPLITLVRQGATLWQVTLTCATGGAAIQFQVRTVGTAPAAYSAYSGAFYISENKVVYAYATHAGLTDSSVATSTTPRN